MRCGGDAEGAGLGKSIAQEVDQRFLDTRVFDADGHEKKLHFRSLFSPRDFCSVMHERLIQDAPANQTYPTGVVTSLDDNPDAHLTACHKNGSLDIPETRFTATFK